ncbi:MAG: mechanosensitive ion channel family protein, partial [Candidatus Micrarchaeia archaeon]
MEKKSKSYYIIYSLLLLVAAGILLVISNYLFNKNILLYPHMLGINALITAVFGILIIEVLVRAIAEYTKILGAAAETSLATNLFRLISYSVLFIIVLSVLNINVTNILIGAGFLGIIVGLAAQSTLGNIFAGISILSARPFKPGDYITVVTWQYSLQPSTHPHERFVPGYSGEVSSIGLLYTKLIGENNAPLYVPNSIINQAMIINHHAAKEKIIHLTIEVSSSVPFTEFSRRLFESLRGTGGLDLQRDDIFVESTSSDKYTVGIRARYTKGEENKLRSRILEAAMRELSYFSGNRQAASASVAKAAAGSTKK